MILIYKDLVQKYLPLLQKQDIINYAKNQNVDLTPEETTIIYNFIHTHSHELLTKNTSNFVLLEKSLRPELYQKILSLYNYYQKYL